MRRELTARLARFCDPDDGTLPEWRDGDPAPVWVPLQRLVDEVFAAVIAERAWWENQDGRRWRIGHLEIYRDRRDQWFGRYRSRKGDYYAFMTIVFKRLPKTLPPVVGVKKGPPWKR